MKLVSLTLLSMLLLCGCKRQEIQPPGQSPAAMAGRPPEKSVSLKEARRGFKSRLLRMEATGDPVPAPPASLFRTVYYDSPVGKLAAYLSQDPHDGKKHPAILWKFGGFSNSIGETAWEAATPENDQSASAFRRAGILMMYPSLRGGNRNPGYREGFFGEVDDLLAAADYLARQADVDPRRIYLGGHSTGGTLALLAAESTDRFRAVFSFGPVADIRNYGTQDLPFDTSDEREYGLRSPAFWMDSIRSPVFVFEGTEDPSNLVSLQAMARVSRNPAVHFYAARGATHFSILAPLTSLIARKILRDNGPTSNITFTENELDNLFAR
jgi:acetyl esterase/lipase